jgi:glucokinase
MSATTFSRNNSESMYSDSAKMACGRSVFALYRRLSRRKKRERNMSQKNKISDPYDDRDSKQTALKLSIFSSYLPPLSSL